MPTFDQLLTLLDRIGICGIALFFLLLHMGQEGFNMRQIRKQLLDKIKKEDT